ncbi:hypothetical protein [Sphingomonas lenta]|nr:hypothetical protein [Sphingomonas lenta]
MTGPQKAALIIALAVVALVAFNVALWRRMKAITREARERAERGGE